ncbi:MAG: hypothetical protein QOG09_937 [Solirubrobacterales bacterium]|nr:hypothetical protein [Solirubrobacterales bacterium]MDX6662835.1 hypothetical protein [Solirubrobacterales bacterium]
MAKAFRSLGPNERLGAIGCLVVLASMFLPWYGLDVSGGIVKTGFGAFDWLVAALLLTIGAVLTMLYETTRGRVLPEPLTEAKLLLVAGGWSALLLIYDMADRPTLQEVPSHPIFGVHYGLLIALGGAALMVLAGFRGVAPHHHHHGGGGHLRRHRP